MSSNLSRKVQSIAPSDLIAHSQRGPYPVGLWSFKLADPADADRMLPVDVWYPASPSDDETMHTPADHPLKAPHRARMGLAPADGCFPLVLFSHGNSGFRRQSTFLTTHLASWGIVVAAPDHVGNTFSDSLEIRSEEQRKSRHFEARQNRPRDMLAVADAMLASRGSCPALDFKAIGALGHSYGGWTSLKLPALDSRICAVCGLAPASEPFVGRKAFTPGELPFSPSLPTLFIAGLGDVLVDIETSIAPLFERMASPSALVGIEGVDHFHFCDNIALLHGLHEKNKRPLQTRETRPYVDMLSETRMHPALCALVVSFFRSVFADEQDDPIAQFNSPGLASLDPALRLISSKSQS